LTRPERIVATAYVCLLALGCQDKPAPGPSASARSSASALGVAPSATASALRSAEHRRDTRAIDDATQKHKDPELRRLATIALSRIADEPARERLLALLHDEDRQVLTWAAYGLGYTCKGRAAELVPRLTLRAASWAARASFRPENKGELEPLAAIADALGRCGGSDAESTLRAWLTRPALAELGARGLGRLTAEHQRLEDASTVALLDAASHKEAPESALLAFTHSMPLSPTVQEHLLTVAKQGLGRSGLARSLAIRALAGAGAAAVAPLSELLGSSEASSVERILAARSLARLADAGQTALGQTLAALLPKLTPAALLSPTFGLVESVLLAISAPDDAAKKALVELASLPLVDGAAPAVRRRVVRLRCVAASLLAGRASAAKLLRECDPDPEGEEGRLAKLSVLDRGPLSGARGRSWRTLVDSKQPRVQQAALRLLSTHPEVEGAAGLLAQALGAREEGTLATAAQVLAAHPERAARDGRAPTHGVAPDTAIIQAFRNTLEREDFVASLEVVAALLDAAGALELLSSKPALERYCKSDLPTLREHAERALVALGDKTRHCTSFVPAKAPPPELPKALELRTPVRLIVKTELGELGLTLDPTLAPVAVARLLDLVKSGHFNGMSVHRVVPGFVVQVGDEVGDGFGHAGRPPIRCETSPVPFQSFDVGMALAGRDTASSQFFVTLERYPRLDGNFAWVGRAGPEWARLAQGDRILEVTLAR